MKSSSYVDSREQLTADFKAVVADAEALLRATANQGGEELAALRTKAEESLRVAKTRLADGQAALLANTKRAAKATDDYVHDNPWTALGLAAGVGLLLGLLTGRRSATSRREG